MTPLVTHRLSVEREIPSNAATAAADSIGLSTSGPGSSLNIRLAIYEPSCTVPPPLEPRFSVLHKPPHPV